MDSFQVKIMDQSLKDDLERWFDEQIHQAKSIQKKTSTS